MWQWQKRYTKRAFYGFVVVKVYFGITDSKKAYQIDEEIDWTIEGHQKMGNFCADFDPRRKGYDFLSHLKKENKFLNFWYF